MAAAIQIVVVAALISAWIWVFRRPLVHGVLAVCGRLPDQDPFHAHRSAPAGPSRRDFRDRLAGLPFVGRWVDRPRVVRRRQLMLANLFAVFASFLLAIALRGLMVHLLGLMLAVLAVHVAVAAVKGARMAESHQQAQLVEARRQARPAGTMTIRASRVVADVDGPRRRILADEVLASYPAGDVSLLDGLPMVPPIGDLEVSTLVEELIEREWGAGDLPAVPSAESAAAAPAPEPVPGSEVPVTAEAEVSAPVEPAVPVAAEPAAPPAADPEPIFTKPGAAVGPRPRRKPRPIYIHSHLDEDGFVPPQAVNHP